MNAYESMYILSPTFGDEEIDGLISKFDELITSNGGEVTKTDRMGRRRLAYVIGDHTEGYYVILYFNATADIVAELERVYRITDGVVRYLIIRKDK